LIVDKDLVDNEQIYQQLQLYNNDTSSSIGSLTKFFSKCVLGIDSLSFNVELKKNALNRELNGSSGGGGGTTDNLEDDDSNNGEDEHYLSDAEDDDESVLSDDSVENMLKNSKIKVDIKNKEKNLVNAKINKKKEAEKEFGIPDGSDSEISDFEVNDNPIDENEEDEEEDVDDEDGENNLDEEDEEEDDIDSDEVDEDLVDLYTDLGDEKEVMGIGKPSKSFNQVNFDKEDCGLEDENDEDDEENGAVNEYDNEPDESEKQAITEKQTKAKDLFNVGESDEDEKKNGTASKSSFEIRQKKVSEHILIF